MNKIAIIFCTMLISSIGNAQKNKQYKIVYNVYEDRATDNYDIYSMNMDGGNKKNLTNSPGVEWAYIADGGTVYYLSDKDTCRRCYFLYSMDAEGNNKKKITDLQMEDSWMGVNGRNMVVIGRKGNQIRNQVFLVNLPTGNYEQYTNDTVANFSDPVFYNANQILLRYRPDKAQRKSVPMELFVTDFKKGLGNMRQISFYPKNDTTAKWFDYHTGPPKYSYNGFYTYMSKQNGQTQIYAFKEKFSGKLKQWQITTGELNSGWHSWSNDGKWLVMDKSNKEDKSFDIYLMNYKTRKETRIADSEKSEFAPIFVETN